MNADCFGARHIRQRHAERLEHWRGRGVYVCPAVVAKAEYSFLDFGKDNIPLLADSVGTRVHEFKFGVNYHFAPDTLFERW